MKKVEMFLHRKLPFGMLGFALAMLIELASIFVMFWVVLSLPSISNFSEVATPSLVSLFSALAGAAIALLTLRSDTEENTD